MRDSILLKILKQFNSKAAITKYNECPWLRILKESGKQSPLKSNAGFTFIEVIVVTLMLGILSAIAGPSWLAFVNNQRLSAANDRVLQSVRNAQSEAKRTKRSQSPQPIAQIHPSIQTTYPAQQLQFNHQGAVQSLDVPYRINVSITNSTSQRCVVVKTLLGATITGKSAAECDAIVSGS